MTQKRSFRTIEPLTPRYPEGKRRDMTRRDILVAVAALSGTALLAACGLGDTSGAPQPPDYRPPDAGDSGPDSTTDASDSSPPAPDADALVDSSPATECCAPD